MTVRIRLPYLLALLVAACVATALVVAPRAAAPVAPAAVATTDSAPAPLADVAECEVTSITDGDTLRCGELRVRLLGIDTPERGQLYGDSATAALARMVQVGDTVTLAYDVERTDRYGRALAYVYDRDGYFVNEELVRGGYALALHYDPNGLHRDRLGAAQAEARIYGHGLWKVDGFACTPKQYRAKECGR